jgi:hypothetical protein
MAEMMDVGSNESNSEGSDRERRHKISTAQGKEDANDSVIKHNCSGGGVMIGGVTKGLFRPL